MINRLNILLMLAGLLLLVACSKEDINELPGAATLVSPANGAVVALKDLAFEFNKGSDPEKGALVHRLMLTNDSITWYEVKWNQNPMQCDLELKEGQKYHWKVQVMEYDTNAKQVIEGRMTESKVFYFNTNAPNVFELKAESSSHTNFTGRNFVKLSWLEPENTDFVEVTFEPQVEGIQQPIEVPAGTGELLIEDFFNNWEPLKKEDAKVYMFAVKAYDANGLAAVPDTIKAMPLDKHLVHDYDFNVYGTVMINNQVWLDVNLMTTHFNNGEAVYHEKGLNKKEYGYYYNRLSLPVLANNMNPCPCGFHVPTDEEWKTLERSIGMPEDKINEWYYRGEDKSYVLKSKSGWLQGPNGENYNGTDQYGFNMKATGSIEWVNNTEVKVRDEGVSAWFLTSTSIDDEGEYYIVRWIREDGGIRISNNPAYRSIRCIRDY